MAYTFVGYNKTQVAAGNVVTVDLSSLTGGVRANNDIAYIEVVGGVGTSLGLWTPTSAGWTNVLQWLRAPGGGFGWVGNIFQKTLDGTEGVITFTDTGARGITVFAAASVYRGVGFPTNYNSPSDPVNSASTLAPYDVSNPTDVSATVPSQAHALGTTPQLLMYAYEDLTTGSNLGSIVRTATDANLFERWNHTIPVAGGGSAFFAWFDEPYASAANYPTRNIQSHWTSGTNLHFVNFNRFQPTSDQHVAVVVIPESKPANPRSFIPKELPYRLHTAWLRGFENELKRR